VAAEPGDEDLVWLWVRRPVIEWALRRAAGAEPGVELRSRVHVSGLVTAENGSVRAVGVEHMDAPIRNPGATSTRSSSATARPSPKRYASEEIFQGLASTPPPPAGPPRDELLARISGAAVAPQ
jgi:hypothetical protein